ncbi:MAG TPA: GGDEF domain-containing protein [Polyangia bacterium]|jgi:diguanylate cyclase (GGDEF)-like protein|nr:GGDEF domain-containing protein [Polyangia bacterium]
MREALKTRLESCRTLPAVPAVAAQVLRLCQQENFNMSDVARVIGGDPALTMKVLKVVNSPLFGLRQQVTTVSHALMLLGVNAVRTMALSFSLVQSSRPVGQGGLDQRIYWKRSLFAACAARELARMEKAAQPEEAFLAGLLQDVGMLALEQAVPEVYPLLARQAASDHDRMVLLEVAEFGCDHAEVGRWLMSRWRLPDNIRAAVGASHDPTRWQRGLDAPSLTMMKVVALSGPVAAIFIDRDVPAAVRTAAERALDVLGIEPDRLKSVLDGVGEAIATVGTLFELPGSARLEVAATIEQAKTALAEVAAAAVTPPPLPLEGGAGVRPVDPSVRRDRLTGLASQLRFDEYLGEEFEASKRAAKPLSLLLCEIDDFAMVNATFGTPGSDRALIAVGGLLSERLRYRDLAGRLAGDRFGIILTDTHAAGAAVVAERMRRKVEDGYHDIGAGDPIRLTLSVGCVTLDEALAFPSVTELVRAMARALEQAQRAGRNRVRAISAASGMAAA